MNKPTDAEVLQLALEPDIDLEFDRVMRMSDEEIRQSLIARGHDLRVLEAEADILWSMYRPQQKRMRGRHLAGAIAFVGSAGAAAAALLGPFAQAAAPIVATVATAASAAPTAGQLREEGLAACQKADWRTCIELLDAARSLDREGDAQPAVVAARKLASESDKP
jgi:hypothetical protein